jgi:proteasome accessory factor C
MTKVTTEGRLQRILALVPWISAHGEPTVNEVCERFEITPSELAADLELLYLCGLHPYTPELLIEATIEDGRVRIAYADYFSRPLRLTPQEGLALVASASALLAAPGSDPDGPLARGLTKLTAALGTEDALDVQLGSADPEVVRILREAIESSTQVTIDYWSYARGARSVRVIEPDATFSVGGQHYVSAWCTTANDERIFRMDRVLAATAVDSPRTHPRSQAAPALFRRIDPSEGGTVTLLLEPSARWVVEQYPVDHHEERSGGRIEVALMVTEWAWLDRLVLRLGAQAQILAAPAGWSGRSDAAKQVLARYRT